MRLRPKRGNRFGIPLGVILGAAAGFAAGLLLAPQTGRRSRKLVVDKVTKYSNDLRDMAEARSKYYSNRMHGMVHEMEDTWHLTSEPTPTDSQVVQRVRADLGHDPNIPLGLLDIEARDGVVYLRGTIDSKETADYVANRVSGVDGVKDDVNELNPAVQ